MTPTDLLIQFYIQYLFIFVYFFISNWALFLVWRVTKA